jgi:hypothetical protein
MTPLKSRVTYDDFSRLDLRIGKVVDVQPFPSGVDLTFATRQAANSQSECQVQTPLDIYIC